MGNSHKNAPPSSAVRVYSSNSNRGRTTIYGIYIRSTRLVYHLGNILLSHPTNKKPDIRKNNEFPKKPPNARKEKPSG